MKLKLIIKKEIINTRVEINGIKNTKKKTHNKTQKKQWNQSKISFKKNNEIDKPFNQIGQFKKIRIQNTNIRNKISNIAR